MNDINLEAIVEVIEVDRELCECFLDMATGEVVSIPLELVRIVEEDEITSNVPAWENDLTRIAKSIFVDEDPRWVLIPSIPSWEIYDQMTKFADSVTDATFRDLLHLALDGPGAFRRFRDVLSRFPEEQERWYKAKQSLLEGEVRAWLGELGVQESAPGNT